MELNERCKVAICSCQRGIGFHRVPMNSVYMPVLYMRVPNSLAWTLITGAGSLAGFKGVCLARCRSLARLHFKFRWPSLLVLRAPHLDKSGGALIQGISSGPHEFQVRDRSRSTSARSSLHPCASDRCQQGCNPFHLHLRLLSPIVVHSAKTKAALHLCKVTAKLGKH